MLACIAHPFFVVCVADNVVECSYFGGAESEEFEREVLVLSLWSTAVRVTDGGIPSSNVLFQCCAS